MHLRRVLIRLGIPAAAAVALAAEAPRLVLDGAPELFLPGLVSTARTEIRLTVSPDGSRMLWGSIGWTGGPGGWEILESVRTAGGWSEPHPVAFDTPANEFDPSFAPDGSGVYFFSNRPGGCGGDDLYYAPFDAGRKEYGPARNLGPAVNSAGDEWAPVVSPDGRQLLFATNGRGGRGGHDLFLARRAGDGTWQDPVPLGAVNTPDDDFDATFLPDNAGLVYASGRLDGRVSLCWAPWLGTAYGTGTPLDERVNPPGAASFTNGPSVAAGEPGWLYFSGQRAGGAGRMDLYRIRYHLTPPVTSGPTAGAARR